jgi:hypothetical protein
LDDLPTTIPHSVRERLDSFRDVAAQRHGALMGASAERRRLYDLIIVGKSRLVELERAGMKGDHPEVLRSLQQLERDTAQHAVINERVQRLEPPWSDAAGLLKALETYVAANRLIALHAGTIPELQPGERALDGLQRATKRTEELKEERSQIASRPLPTEFARRSAREELLARMEGAKPDFAPLVDRGEHIRFPKNRAALQQYSGTDLYAIDPIGVLMWVFKDELLAAADREIEAHGRDDIALTHEERTAKLAEIDAAILRSEREECAFAELAGRLPRADCDPRAALGLDDTMPAPERS